MVAMGIAQILRIGGYLRDGSELAPINYPWRSCLFCFALVGAAIALVPAEASAVVRLGWAFGSCVVLLVAMFSTALVDWPLRLDLLRED